VRPSGAKAPDVICAEWPLKRLDSLPDAASERIASRSSPKVATVVPAPSKTTACTAAEWLGS
jgi:hypothetical protein